MKILRQNILSYIPSIVYSSMQKHFTDRPTLLGRWKIETNDKTNTKIDFANEDHCGICNDYIMEKNINLYKYLKKQ